MAQKTQIDKWCEGVILGIGGMNDAEKYELIIWNEPERVAAAKWVIRCLANPACEGSEEVFNAIAARRAKMTPKSPDQIAFEDIATAHPHEAHQQNPQRFCDFVRSKGNNLTDEEIAKNLEETK